MTEIEAKEIIEKYEALVLLALGRTDAEDNEPWRRDHWLSNYRLAVEDGDIRIVHHDIWPDHGDWTIESRLEGRFNPETATLPAAIEAVNEGSQPL